MAESSEFAEWLRTRAKRAGYDVDAAKGGRSALAAAAGMSVTQIGRTLEGKTVPSIESQRGLAHALDVSVLEMLLRTGMLEREDIRPGEEVPLTRGVDPETVADYFGVGPEYQHLFFSAVGLVAAAFREAEEAARDSG